MATPAAGASAGACVCVPTSPACLPSSCTPAQGTCTVPDIAFPQTCAVIDENICDQTGLVFSGGTGAVATRTPFNLARGATKTAVISNKEWVYVPADSVCTKVCDWAGAASNGITNSADGSTTRKASIKSGNCETACNFHTMPLVCNATEVSPEECIDECYSPVLAGLMEAYFLGVKASEQMDDMITKGFYQNKSGSECTYGVQCEAGKVLGQLINCGYMEVLAEAMDRGMCTYLGWGLFSLSMGAYKHKGASALSAFFFSPILLAPSHLAFCTHDLSFETAYGIFMIAYFMAFILLVLGYKRWNRDYQEKG